MQEIIKTSSFKNESDCSDEVPDDEHEGINNNIEVKGYDFSSKKGVIV